MLSCQRADCRRKTGYDRAVRSDVLNQVATLRGSHESVQVAIVWGMG